MIDHRLPADLVAQLPQPVRTIARVLQQAGFRAWVVGGCTRDLLLGRAVSDWDLATDAKPEQVIGLFRRVIPTGIKHGTVTVLQGGEGFEVTTLRGEGAYSDGRHPDSVTFVDDLREDLARRDFTVNAIAIDPATGEVNDPFGGLTDLSARLLRAVGDAAQRFNEDGLRVMRAARFCAVLEFDIEPATLGAIATALNTLRKVSMERVRDELLKTLAAREPSRGLRVMMDSGIFAIVLPELTAMVGCEQNRYHTFDVWEHTLRCVDACEGDAVLRLAMLLHDVGKPVVRGVSDKTQDYTFYGHESEGAVMADKLCMALRMSNQERHRIVHLVRHHLIVYDASWSDAAVRRWLQRVGRDNVEALLAMGRADAAGKGTDPAEQLACFDELRERVATLEAQGTALSVRDLAVNGRDLMRELALPPSPLIGQLLEQLLEAVLEDPTVNERDKLLEKARDQRETLSMRR